MKVAKTYRIDPDVIKQLDKIQLHLQDRFDDVALNIGTKPQIAKNIDALEFAIKFTFDKLKEEGYIN